MNELPKRKAIRIEDYDYSTPGAYFITVCTANREKIFWSDRRGELCSPANVPLSDIGMIVDNEIKKLNSVYDAVRVDKYCIMPDHIHLLLRIDSSQNRLNLGDEDGMGSPSPSLGNIVGWYKYQTSKQINLMNGTIGEIVFQRSYYDHVIRNQQDYDEIWEYIENNPAKWIKEKFYEE